MTEPRITDALPDLVRDGLISAEQAERIHARYAGAAEGSGNRMLLVFAILGSLLVGLGIILIIAHNWDDLSRSTRTALAFAPVLLGQGLVLYTLNKKPDVAAWREGSALLLACGLCACVALISQIHHIGGNLEGYLLTCSLLILPLLYLPGSFTVALGYLGMITWYAWTVRFGDYREHDTPWYFIGLLITAFPFYLGEARRNGSGAAFWWLSLCMALATGIGSQLFYQEWERMHALGLVALAALYTLIPWLHREKPLRTWPWVLLGGATMLIVFLVFSYRPIWDDEWHLAEVPTSDRIVVGSFVTLGLLGYAMSMRVRRPFEGSPYPEGFLLFGLCYLVGLWSPVLAAILINLALLLLGVITIRHGIERDSLKRMNLGLTILSATILLRFFDTDMSFVLRGLAFIALGCAFLFMNLRMVRQRERQRHGA